jgi:uncharacterized protein YbaR (Trm112 family)
MLQAESVKQPSAPAQYVDAPKLLEILFAPECRPSLRWLREQQAARKFPSVKIGRLVFFDPAACKAALDARAKGKASAA